MKSAQKIPNQNPELEYRLLYAMVVAGKSATFAEAVIRRLLATHPGYNPFDAIRSMIQQQTLLGYLKVARTGNYTKLERGFREAVESGLNLATCTAEDLEKIHGIGPKTSRFFIIWTRPAAAVAALDTHVLKWLRYLGHDAPAATPTGVKYEYLQSVFLAEAGRRGMTAREVDAAIWDWCSAGRHKGGEWPDNLQRLGAPQKISQTKPQTQETP